jgi:hypothetical protein
VVIATGVKGSSKNAKTGGMVQTYILRQDIAPHEAVKVGADASICGDCKHRGDGTGKGRTCYVTVFQGPLSTWKAWTRGAYPIASHGEARRTMAGKRVRLGTYGDPAAVPLEVWESLLVDALGWTGYTHQWQNPTNAEYADYLMASADTPEEAREAWAEGWRTFRVSMPLHDARMSGEAVCPASEEAGKKLQCADCMACHGTALGRRGSITIRAHGSSAVMKNVRERYAA